MGASAAAAVTSALAASFFGVAGTLIGAALGSIVSTIAGALYADYLGRAGQRIKVTRSVVIQRIPGEVLATTPLRHLTRPTDLPGRQSMQPIGDERGAEAVSVPVQGADELRRQPEGLAPLDRTSVLPAYGSPAAEAALRATQASGRNGANGAASNGAGTHGADRSQEPGPSRPLWKRPMVAISAVSAAGFVIALGVVLATELFLGHPLSGGESGNTLSKLGSTSSNRDVTPTPSETPAPSATSSSAAATEVPVVPSPSTDAATTAPAAPTGQPTPEATDPAAAATDSGVAGSDSDAGVAATPVP